MVKLVGRGICKNKKLKKKKITEGMKRLLFILMEGVCVRTANVQVEDLHIRFGFVFFSVCPDSIACQFIPPNLHRNLG